MIALLTVSKQFQRELVLQEYTAKFNSLPNNKILDLSKLKAFADDKATVAKMMISLFDRVENIVEKEENAGNQHFLLFQKYHQNHLFHNP